MTKFLNAVALCAVFVFTAFAGTRASAQNYERYRPLSPVGEPIQLPALQAEEADRNSSVDDHVIVASLDAIRVVDSHDKVITDTSIDELVGIHYDIDHKDSLVLRSAVRGILKRHLEKPVSLRSLNDLTKQIVEVFRRSKLPITDVLIPEQRITTGTLHLVVIESRIGKVRVRPGQFFDCNSVARWIECTRAGARVYEPCLENDLLWLNQNPFRRVSVDFEKGSKPGTTDVVYEVSDVRPVKGYVGIDDTGVETLNFGRFFAGFQYGNFLNRGGILGYQYTTDEEFALLRAHSLSLLQPISRQSSASTYGSWAGVASDLGGGLLQDGESYQFGAELQKHTIRTATRGRDWVAGVDFKSSNNALEFAQLTVSNSHADLLQLRLGLRDWEYKDRDDFHSLKFDTFVGPGGGFTGKHSAAAFATLRPGATPDYVYGRLNLNAASILRNRFAFHRRFAIQASSERLLYSETLGIGGFDSVRGLDQRVYSADHGWVANLEFGPRTYSYGEGRERKSLRLYGFMDVANGYVDSPLPGEDATTMAISSGAGFRFQLSDRLIARFDYGASIRENIPTVGRNSRGHFSLTWIPGKRP